MPYQWSQDIDDLTRISRSDRYELNDPPALSLLLSAHNSLTPRGFVQFAGLTAILMSIPLLAFLGTPFLWVILVSMGVTFALMWLALKQSWKRGSVTEILDIWPDHLRLQRHNPNGTSQTFEANPYWTRVDIVVDTGPVPHYLTLSGADRKVEIGSFLSENERQELYADLKRVLPGISRVLL